MKKPTGQKAKKKVSYQEKVNKVFENAQDPQANWAKIRSKYSDKEWAGVLSRLPKAPPRKPPKKDKFVYGEEVLRMPPPPSGASTARPTPKKIKF